MHHHCPHCRVSLARRLIRSKPLPGERRFLPLHAVQACPDCGGLLAMNTHWSELAFLALVAVPCLFLHRLLQALGRQQALWLAGGIVVAAFGVALVFHLRYWRHWQRYKPWVESPRRRG